MKKILIPFGILSLISTIIFSVLSSNSYAFFIENQNRLFIEDAVIIKVFDGEVYTTVKDVNEKLKENYDSYVMYSKDGDTVYVYNHNYDRMLNLKMNDNQVVEQQSGKYTFKQLDIDSSSIREVFIAAKGVSEGELINLFINPETNFTDGSVARFIQSYEGMIGIGFYIALIVNIVIINLLFVLMYINTYKERVGVMKVLGYSTTQITDRFVKRITILYLLSLVVVYLVNHQYINFMFTQSYVFSQMISILAIYIFTLFTSIFMSGAVIYYLVEKRTVSNFLREVSYD